MTIVLVVLIAFSFSSPVIAEDETQNGQSALDVVIEPDVSVADEVYENVDTAPLVNPNPGEIAVFVNNKLLELDVAPTVENNRTLVPLRAIFEALGVNVEWNANDGTITATRDTTEVKLSINNTKALINGSEVVLDAPATVVNERTLVPLRFVSEALGAEVNWDSKTNIITVNQ